MLQVPERSLRDAVIVDAIRTPIGKYAGVLKTVRPDDLAAHVLRAVLTRTGVDPASVDDVYLGAANQAGEDNRNVARMAALLAGLPVTVPGATVNRLCGSGLQAVISAAREIQVGAARVVLAGGVESMTRAPYVMLKAESVFQRGTPATFDTTLGWRMVNPRMEDMYPPVRLGDTAENVAERYEISRDDQDAYALDSHRKAVSATNAGLLREEIVSIEVPGPRNSAVRVEVDEGPRADTSMEKLAKLRPAFRVDGSVTAGNSSTLNDGAAALVLMSREAAERAGLQPFARFVAAAACGVDPALMGMGPVPATRKVLDQVGLAASDIDVVEINEAFASQVLACLRELGIPMEKVNPNGGAIALGHPLGASGGRLVTSLVRQLKRSGGQFGLATMCIGAGQGISAIFERETA